MKSGKRINYIRKKTKALFQQTLPSLKPCAICIGAQKAGTTALYRYLANHPGVALPNIKEINFFNCDSRYYQGYRFYHSHFPTRTPFNSGKLTFDITPGYLGGAEKAAIRIHNYNPNIRLIVLLRNPIKRAQSAWEMYRRFNVENRDWFWVWMRRCNRDLPQDSFVKRSSCFGQSFQKDISEEIEAIQSGRVIEMPILRLGMYYIHLRHYYDLFNQDQILIISSEDFRQGIKEQLRLIEAFVGLTPHSWTQDELKLHLVGTYDIEMAQDDYMLLESFYRDHNLALFDLLQREFAWN
jgi:hypothetical protein